jgi:phosphoglycerate dehydrogenase-like enzyme
MKVAILDDYLGVARRLADWSALERRCEITVFDRNLKVPDEAAEALAPFDIFCCLRERMAVPRALIERLPKLKFIAVTGFKHRTLDLAAATERGIVVSHSGVHDGGHSTPELAWGLILASVRHIADEAGRMRAGGWQNTLGTTLHGKTLGIVGLGGIGRKVAGYGQAFGMRVLAWSQNLTDEAAAAGGATRVDKDVLFRESDIVTLHLVLGDRTRGIVGARELALMKPTATLVNTARAPLLDPAALLETLQAGRIRGAALDVFDQEPLPDDHPLRRLDNVILTPHLGYCTEETLSGFYADTVQAVTAFLDGKPVRVLNPEAVPPAATSSGRS